MSEQSLLIVSMLDEKINGFCIEQQHLGNDVVHCPDPGMEVLSANPSWANRILSFASDERFKLLATQRSIQNGSAVLRLIEKIGKSITEIDESEIDDLHAKHAWPRKEWAEVAARNAALYQAEQARSEAIE